jgi:alcohol dehydrogenase
VEQSGGLTSPSAPALAFVQWYEAPREPAGMAAASSPAAAITCRAAVAWAPGQALVMEEVEVAPPEAMEIRVKVVSTSICRSDVTQWQSTVRRPL